MTRGWQGKNTRATKISREDNTRLLIISPGGQGGNSVVSDAGDHRDEIRECVLQEEPCTGCLECLYCDLDPHKECDNCMVCVADEADFRAILVDDILWLQEQVPRADETDQAVEHGHEGDDHHGHHPGQDPGDGS